MSDVTASTNIDADETTEVEFGQGNNSIQVSEHGITRELRQKEKQLEALQQKKLETERAEKGFLKFHFQHSVIPWLKYGVGMGAFTYLLGAYTAPYVTTQQNIFNALMVAAVALPAVRGAEKLGEKIGYALGHFNNWRKSDRFHEVKSTPDMRGAWRGSARMAVLLVGPLLFNVWGPAAVDMVKDVGHVGSSAYHLVVGKDQAPAPEQTAPAVTPVAPPAAPATKALSPG